MKRVLFMIAFVIAAMAAIGQRGVVYTIATDTIKGAETVTFNAITVSGSYQSLSIAAKCIQLGGTTDGTLEVQASNDGTNYFNLNNIDGKMLYASPYARMNDSIVGKLNMYNAATLNFVIPAPPHKYYRLSASGTANDTTKLTLNYIFK